MVYLGRLRWPSIGSVLLMSVPFFVVRLGVPLHFDNCLYQAMALDVVRYGRYPYLGTWDQNFPGIIYIHSLGMLCFGTSELGMKFFDVLIQIGFIVVVYRLLMRWFRPQTAALATILYVAYYVGGGASLSMQRDVYVTITLILSYALISAPFNKRYTILQFIIAGLVMGLSIAIKPTALIFLATTSLYILLRSSDATYRRLRALMFILISLVPIGAFLLWYTFIPGGINAFYLSTIRFNLDVYNKLVFGFSDVVKSIAFSLMLLPLGLLGILLCWKWTKQLKVYVIRVPPFADRVLYASYLIGSLFVLILQQKFYRYHFAPLLILLIPFAVLAIESLCSKVKSRTMRYGFIMLFLFFSNGFLWTMPANLRQGMCYSEGPDRFHHLHQYLEQPDHASAEIEICAYDPGYRWELRRRCVGPYPAFHALAFCTNPGCRAQPQFTGYQHEWQREYVALLRGRAPRFIMIDRASTVQYLTDAYATLPRYIPEFDSILANDYSLDTTLDGVLVFQRKLATNRNSQ